jgi:benzoylformate decarboxylase
MIVEDGVTKNDALNEVVAFAEKIGAGVYQPWMADVNFPVHHPQYLYDLNVNSPATREMFKKHDVVVVVGSLFFSQAVYVPEPFISPPTKVIQIDNNPWQLGKNYPIDCGVEGNIKTALQDLMDALDKASASLAVEKVQNRIQHISSEKQKMVAAFRAEAVKHRNDSPIHGTRLMDEIHDALPPNARIVDDCWSYSAILRRTLPLQEPRSYMRARGGGSIGWGLPGAIGVKMASPDRPVVCISGDGSAMWSIQSLWTASHYQIPVTFIILSNGCYRQVRMMKTVLMGQGAKGRDLGTTLESPRNDFCKLAEGMGLTAQRVETPDRLKEALEKAFALNQPNLVEVVVDSSL